MDYVATLTFRSSVQAADRDGALMRRADWKYPDNIDLIAEYWPMAAAPQVVSIFTTDDPAALLQLELEWSDVFDVDISPALSADDGLRAGPEVFARLARIKAA